MEIIIGILASLVATVIWVVLTQLYDINSRRNIAFLLELLYDCADSFDSAIEFSNYSTAETEAEKILEYCKEILDNIKPLTFLGKKRKLFYTILYNAYYSVSCYKRVWVGYDKEQEREAKFKRFKMKYYYKVNIYDNHHTEPDAQSFLIVSIVILQSLNRCFFVRKALTDNMYINRFCIKLSTTYSELIAPLNFKSDYTYRFDLRKNCFTCNQYKKYIQAIFKVEE